MQLPPTRMLTHTEPLEQMRENLPDIPTDSKAFKSLMEAEDPVFVALACRAAQTARFSSTQLNISNTPKGE